MDSQFCDKAISQCCGECGKNIRDKYLLYAVDRYWHIGCLKCSICRVMLADAGKSCFARAGLLLCKDDYIRLFGRNGVCSSCHETIPPNEMVMKIQDHVYHIRCFSCSRCHFPLAIGDRYRLCDGKIVCYDRECMGLSSARKGVMVSRRGGRAARIPNAVKA